MKREYEADVLAAGGGTAGVAAAVGAAVGALITAATR